MTNKSDFTVALVGPGQQENLPLAYLGAALEAGGFTPMRLRYDDHHDREACITALLRENPPLVGMSIAFQFVVMDILDFIGELRLRGYRGHITCGGHVPTFCFDSLLADCEGLDSVIRHEGEETLVALATAIYSGTPTAGIPGLVTRGESGLIGATQSAPLLDVDTLSPPLRPQKFFEIGGVPITFILTSRGCVGECHYCSISAFNRSTAGPKYRLRSPEQVADEVAGLYHQKGARVFFVQDDLFILPSEQRTLARLEALTDALKRRRVADAMFWIKGRPESITERVLKDAWQMGARHLFLGVEHSVDARLAYLGRRHRHSHNVTAIEKLRQAGMRPSFNLMMFDPDCTVADVESVIQFGESCAEIPWNICRTEVYPGTTLYQKLLDADRLQGDYRTFGYTMSDVGAEVLFRILRVSLHEHAFDVNSLLNKLISLSFARQIHEHFLPGPETDRISKEVDALIAASHQATVREIRESIRFVKSRADAGFGDVRAFAASQAERLADADSQRFEQVRQMWDFLSASGEMQLGRRLSTFESNDPHASKDASKSENCSAQYAAQRSA